jgi:branched-chain amino acid transport system ATP-binding protein
VTADVPSGPVVLTTKGLCKDFGGVHAVKDVDLEVHEGTITALIGPNGAGKTTVFNLITGLYSVTAGSVVLRTPHGGETALVGRQVDAITRLGIARTFQNIRLFSDVAALDNVKLGMHPRTHRGALSALLRFPAREEERQVHRAAYRYLDFVGLADQSHELARNLPYGAQRRLEIARALALDPVLLLLDEPAAGMNPQETEELMALIRRIRGLGITVLLIEHDMKLVMGISDYVFVLDHGEEIAFGAPAHVKNDPEVIRAYLGDEAIS